jgi:hypothetical protein
MSTRIDETRADAREARDAATKLTERVDAQAVPAKVAELRADLDKNFAIARSDLVNASDKITREMREGLAGHDTRIKQLEAFRSKVEGATGFLGWTSKNAPWLFALLAGIAATIGWKDKLP